MAGCEKLGRVLKEENSRTKLRLSPDEVEPKKLPQYLAASLATIGAFSAGSYMSWSSSALPLMKSNETLPYVTDEEGSWVGSLLNVGAVFGALPAGLIADKIGRKFTLVSLCVPLFASWLLISLCSSTLELYIGRVLGGIAIGAISVAAPMYITELSESKVRGALGTLFQLQITIGILFGYIVGLIPDHRLIGLACGSIPVLYLATFIWMPESPVYLLMKGHTVEARSALQWFRGRQYDVDDEMTKLQDAVDEAEKKRGGLVDLITDSGLRKALFISVGLMLFQQISGVNAVIFYSGQIFSAAGNLIPAEAASIAVGFVQVLATYGSSLLVDRLGRRSLLLLSNVFMGVCLSVLGTYFHLLSVGLEVQNFAFIPLISVAVFIIMFSLGFGPIPWIMVGELFPSNVKGVASAIAASCSWLTSFMVTKGFQNLVCGLGKGITFWSFAGISVLGTVFVIMMVPETKGKHLEEIQIELRGKQKVKSVSVEDGKLKQMQHFVSIRNA